jgi:hypothetical protein
MWCRDDARRADAPSELARVSRHVANVRHLANGEIGHANRRCAAGDERRGTFAVVEEPDHNRGV